MKTDTKDKILEFIKNNKEVSTNSIYKSFDFSYQIISRHIKRLLDEGFLEKHGKPPFVFYSIKNKQSVEYKINLKADDIKIIDSNYWRVNSSGNIESGSNGFASWCMETNNIPIEKTAIEYIKAISDYKKYRKNGLINATDRTKKVFGDDFFADEIYYSDFYSIPKFGKTKLGSMVLYSKQNANINIIKEIYNIVKDDIYNLIKIKNIDAVAFIPPTIKRPIQFQSEMRKLLSINLPHIELRKIENDIAVPQKTLKKIEERINNAKSTIFLNDVSSYKYKNILIIDDAVGSGSTINEVSKKIKEIKLCSGKIYGYAITGSFNGFDVINEV